MPDKNTNNKQEEKVPENAPFEIPVKGSLGLLALGAVGLKAWRKKREEHKASEKQAEKKNG